MRPYCLAITLVVLAAACGLGCGHDAPPAATLPDEPPPLPPASGTPIGYLIDADELKLHGDQRAQLEAIDDDLADRLDVLDGASRSGRPGGPASGDATGTRRRGRRGGGMGGGRAMAGGGGPGAGGRRAQAGSAAHPEPGPGSGAAATGSGAESRGAEIRAAIDRALGVLDADQQVVARRVLAGHGVDVDRRPASPASEPRGPTGSGDP